MAKAVYVSQCPLVSYAIMDTKSDLPQSSPIVTERRVVVVIQGCSRSIDLGGKDQDHLIELDLLW